MENVYFTGTDLENADFSGVDLKNVRFFAKPSDVPYISPELIKTGTNVANASGAFVRGANFRGARNIDGDTSFYLCQWGALNIPGGCSDVIQKKLPYEVDRSLGSNRSRGFGGGMSCGAVSGGF